MKWLVSWPLEGVLTGVTLPSKLDVEEDFSLINSSFTGNAVYILQTDDDSQQTVT